MEINITVIFIIGVVIDFVDDMKNGFSNKRIIHINGGTN